MLRTTRARALRPGQHWEGGTSAAAWAPAVDISERKDAYLVAAELPGVKAEDVEITFEDGLLTIQGERRFAHDADREKVHRAEGSYGAFRRSITLPSHVDADKIEASAQDGVLHILVPKAKEVQAKHIKVLVGHGNTALLAHSPRTAADNPAPATPGNMTHPAAAAALSGGGRRMSASAEVQPAPAQRYRRKRHPAGTALVSTGPLPGSYRPGPRRHLTSPVAMCLPGVPRCDLPTQ